MARCCTHRPAHACLRTSVLDPRSGSARFAGRRSTAAVVGVMRRRVVEIARASASEMEPVGHAMPVAGDAVACRAIARASRGGPGPGGHFSSAGRAGLRVVLSSFRRSEVAVIGFPGCSRESASVRIITLRIGRMPCATFAGESDTMPEPDSTSVCVVTGASSGIGEATARSPSPSVGPPSVVAARRAERLEASRSADRSRPAPAARPDAVAIPCDVRRSRRKSERADRTPRSRSWGRRGRPRSTMPASCRSHRCRAVPHG